MKKKKKTKMNKFNQRPNQINPENQYVCTKEEDINHSNQSISDSENFKNFINQKIEIKITEILSKMSQNFALIRSEHENLINLSTNNQKAYNIEQQIKYENRIEDVEINLKKKIDTKFNQFDNLIENISSKIQHIEQTLDPIKVKEGHIDFSGLTLRNIQAADDRDDAVSYDQLFNEIKKQMVLNNNFLSVGFKKQYSSLVEIIKKMNQRILELEEKT